MNVVHLHLPLQVTPYVLSKLVTVSITIGGEHCGHRLAWKEQRDASSLEAAETLPKEILIASMNLNVIME